MTEHSFSLIPFPDANIPEIKITGTLARQNNLLAIHYSLTGETEQILFPESSAQPARKDELWKATCFEFFLALPDRPGYWEFNMSPSGDWNVYHMDAYRRVDFREETSFQRLPFSVQKESEYVSLEVTVDLSLIIPGTIAVQMGIASIIQTRDGKETYWALAHPAPEADFHRRESFTLQI